MKQYTDPGGFADAATFHRASIRCAVSKTDLGTTKTLYFTTRSLHGCEDFHFYQSFTGRSGIDGRDLYTVRAR